MHIIILNNHSATMRDHSHKGENNMTYDETIASCTLDL